MDPHGNPDPCHADASATRCVRRTWNTFLPHWYGYAAGSVVYRGFEAAAAAETVLTEDGGGTSTSTSGLGTPPIPPYLHTKLPWTPLRVKIVQDTAARLDRCAADNAVNVRPVRPARNARSVPSLNSYNYHKLSTMLLSGVGYWGVERGWHRLLRCLLRQTHGQLVLYNDHHTTGVGVGAPCSLPLHVFVRQEQLGGVSHCRQIARGSYATVYVSHHDNGVVLKHVPDTVLFAREVAVHAALPLHPAVEPMCYFVDGANVLAFPRYSTHALPWLRRHTAHKKTWSVVWTALSAGLSELADGLAACHAAGIIHADLHKGNVMMRCVCADQEPCVLCIDNGLASGAVPKFVLIDFGLAQPVEWVTDAGAACGRPAFGGYTDGVDVDAYAPEYVRRVQIDMAAACYDAVYTASVDAWSFGHFMLCAFQACLGDAGRVACQPWVAKWLMCEDPAKRMQLNWVAQQLTVSDWASSLQDTAESSHCMHHVECGACT